jgi:TonB family protein
MLACLVAGMIGGPLAAGARDAQAGGASVAGVVTDESGGVVRGATVTARSTSGSERSAVTDGSGRYAFDGLGPGVYELRFTQDGFRPYVARVTVAGGSASTIDAELGVGAVSESITLKPGGEAGLPPDNETQLLQQTTLRPDDPQPYLELANLYYQQERFEESAATMARAARLIAEPAPRRPQAASAGGEIDPPRKVRDVLPIYPAAARAGGVSGTVLIDATIAANGTVQAAEVVRGVPLLDDAALAAVGQWMYTPTYLNGVPVPVRVSVRVTFSSE